MDILSTSAPPQSAHRYDPLACYLETYNIPSQPYLGVHASEEVKLYCILSPVGPYYKTGAAKPVSLLANPEYVRAWPGGVGNVKVTSSFCESSMSDSVMWVQVGGNYAPSIQVGAKAAEKGFSQVCV